MNDSITYHLGAVADHARGVVTTASSLDQIHVDATQKTNALTDFFSGDNGAPKFFDAQAQMLSGLQGLIETIGHHGSTIQSVGEGAGATDAAMGNLF